MAKNIATVLSANDGPRRFVLVGNPENRRTQFIQEALARRQISPARVIAYEQLLRGEISLGDVVRNEDVVRIDSPGENFVVEKLLLQAGAEAALAEGSPCLLPDQVDALPSDRGRIVNPRQWYLGWHRLLNQLTAELEGTRASVMNHPQDIAMMFDKSRCQAQFRREGIPAPPVLSPVRSYEELLHRMQQVDQRRVFVKLVHGSSASGVVAFETDGRRERAITTAEMVRTSEGLRLYNSLRLQHYVNRRDIVDLINELCRHHVHVEQWLPKAVVGGMQFDLRIVAIGGRARHAVVRQSRGPLTNLHLGNQRGDLDEVKAMLGPQWESASKTCERVMNLFPRSLYAGIDVAVSPDFRQHAVLEANAFGDLLPGVLDGGIDTYEAELEAALSRHCGARES